MNKPLYFLFMSESFTIVQWKNNFWQRISWLSQRWRTQRIAISNVNCRIQWIIKSLNAHCAFWYSGKHACLRIDQHSLDTFVFALFASFIWSGRQIQIARWIWVVCINLQWPSIECMAAICWWYQGLSAWIRFIPFWFLSFLVQYSAYDGHLTTLFHIVDQFDSRFEHLVSNQVGKPAELKHINKRRKRN